MEDSTNGMRSKEEILCICFLVSTFVIYLYSSIKICYFSHLALKLFLEMTI